MMKYVLIAAVVFAAVSARPEPPAERLEGAKLEPELLSRVRDLLTQDGPGFGGAGASKGSSRSSSTYSAPPPPSSGVGNTYGAPAPGGNSGLDAIRSIASAVAPGAGGGLILLDPELAPLLTTFDLPVTREDRSSRSGGY